MGLIKIFKDAFKKKDNNSKIDDYSFYKNLSKKDYPKFIKKVYKERTKKNLNLNNPKTLSEKIQWLKLYDNLPIKTVLADKIKVRDWVREKENTLCFPEIYGVWDSFQEIDFDVIPDKFFLKMNHGSRMNISIIDKEQFLKKGKKKVAAIVDNWFNTNFAFLHGFELQYRDIPPKVFAEETLIIEKNKNYCVLCFNGKAKYIEQIITVGPENIERVMYDTNWKKQPFIHSYPMIKEEIQPPVNLSEIIRIAEVLAAEFKLVRVDFYEIDEKLYFSEMTFTPCSGHMVFDPEEYDGILGDMLDLNIKESNKIIL